MTTQPADVRETIGSTDLDDTAIQTKIDQASRLYDQRRDGEHVDDPIKDDVVEYLAAHLIKAGPEPEVEGGDDVSFRIPEEGRFWTMATTLDPTGQLDGGEDDASDDFTFSV